MLGGRSVKLSTLNPNLNGCVRSCIAPTPATETQQLPAPWIAGIQGARQLLSFCRGWQVLASNTPHLCAVGNITCTPQMQAVQPKQAHKTPEHAD